MDDEGARRISSLRASFGTFSNFSQNTDADDVDDPISAYFKKRCGNNSKSLFKKPESDRGSSLGIIDVDNVSLFDVEEENDRINFRLSGDLDQVSVNFANEEKTEMNSKALGSVISSPESELHKQRALAQKALKRLSNKSSENLNQESIIMSTEKKECKPLSDISSALMNIKSSDGAEIKKSWLEPNFSPNTPRYFNDELNSFGGECETLLIQHTKYFDDKEDNSNRESVYVKKVNSMYKEIPQIILSSDFEFKTQTKEEQINQFEEDEKKFKLENCGILHNSRISEFSGVTGDTSQWPTDSLVSNFENGEKNLSIGQFFNLRSNRASSLIRTSSKECLMPSLSQELEPSTNSEGTQILSKSEHLSAITHTPVPERPKFRRCVSTCDLKGNSETSKSLRYSSDSCSSNSTALIQDILAEMESGLSGTQMYEKLMKSYGRKTNEVKAREQPEKLKKITENIETPKSSKFPKEITVTKNKKKDVSFQESHKERKSFVSQNSVIFADKKLKEKESKRNKSLNDSVCMSKKEKATKAELIRGFCSSTPKTQTSKSENDKFKTECGKILMNCDSWEAPRVNLIQSSIDLSRSEISEGNDKTITLNSTLPSSEITKHNNNTTINDTLTIEDTIVLGDLTVLSQRIDEMKLDNTTSIMQSEKPEEPLLLKVIQKLSDFPKGSVDCSALTPLIRDQFPELLSSFSTPSKNSVISVPITDKKVRENFCSLPGSWVKLPNAMGLNEKVYACADLQKTILVPVFNISQKWLLVSLNAVELIHPQRKKLIGKKKNNEWCIMDFVVISLKETLIPPNNSQSLKVIFKSKVITKLDLTLTFSVKELLNGEIQTRSLRIVINNVHPENYLNVIPKDLINFGVIGDQCFDHKTIQISFDGICDLPLTIYIDQDGPASGHFMLRPHGGLQQEGKYSGSMLHHVFNEGEKRILEFQVCFQPNVLLKEDSKIQDFKAELIIMLGGKTETDGILKKIPIKGSVGFVKFLWDPSSNPLIFRTSRKNQSISRSFPLKNVGALPIAFSVWISNKDDKNTEEKDTFIAPKSFYLSRNEEAAINVTFNASEIHNCTKRYMMLQINPNGREIYDVELIGITTFENKSRTSSTSVSTKSTANSESVPIKLMTTAHSLSWTATALEKEARQTFQVKSLSSVTISIRITFKINSDVFKLINENGERVLKMRKVLKPDCPSTLTVVFRPDIVGAHLNSLIFESNHTSFRKMIPLCGVGGIPNLFLGNVKSDLNGCKILRLQHSNISNEFENFMIFKNEGRITGFLLITTGMKDFSLSHDLNITPSSFVVNPNSSVKVKISQKLKNVEVHQLLSGKEISKIATICVVTGDEPSRWRIKQLMESGKIQSSERLDMFTAPLAYEQPKLLKNFKDSSNFEIEFLKSLKVYEVAIVIEKNTEILEPSILEETVDEFVTFLSANENTVISTGISQKKKETESNSSQALAPFGNPNDVNESFFPSESQVSKNSKVTEWLETLDCL